jgi:aldehyde dehydrogenase (NAD+)
VLADADLDLAAAGVLWVTFFHNGQVCESGTRALISRKIYDEFVGMLVERASKIVVGDNMDMATDQGPLVAPSQVDTTERYVKLGLDEGAKLLCGGAKPTDLPAGLDQSAYYLPTIFEADNSMKIAQEEIFGPVLTVIPFDDDAEVVALANDSIYGLGGAVWSGNTPRAVKVAEGLRTGTVWINDYHMINPKYPFGGYKQSGLGREHGIWGLNQYLETKYIRVAQEATKNEKFWYQVLGV